MSETIITVLGAGSVRCSPQVISALANYFGERPLEIRFFDADEERLDLFDRFARLCFSITKAPHRLLYRVNAEEALEKADRVILQVGTNCARKYLKSIGKRPAVTPEALLVQADGFPPEPVAGHLVEEALNDMIQFLPDEAEVLSLQRTDIRIPLSRYYRLDWPDESTLEERSATPLQVLRWLKGEEMPHKLLQQGEVSPLRAWLDDVGAATLVEESG